MSSEVTQSTGPQSASSSAPPPPSPSPSSSLALQVIAALVSVAAMSWIGAAWMLGRIPDWKYGMAGILIASLPAGVIGDLAKVAIRRLAGK